MAMNPAQTAAYGELMDAGDTIRRNIVRAKSDMQPLALPDDVLAKLTEAREALNVALRQMEAL
jgi:hypothetical protein